MNIDLSAPIVWTSKGNVNESTTEKFSEWEFDKNSTPEAREQFMAALAAVGGIAHIMGHRDRETGEIIKRGAWVLHPGLSAAGVTGNVG